MGKEREALTVKAEDYKKQISKYLESRGYVLDVDSGIEGVFEDQIYYKKGRKRINVECKDTQISVYEAEFLIPFSQYLVLFSKLPNDAKFQFSFFVRKVRNYAEFDLLFNKLDDTKMLELKKRCIEVLEKKQKKKFVEMAGQIEKISLDIFREFAYDSEIVEADYETLKRASEIRLPDMGVPSSILDILPPKNISEILDINSRPDKVNEKLLANLFPVIEYPKKIWGAKTKFRRKKDVYKELESHNVPAFTLKEEMLFCFWDLNDEENPLNTMVYKNTISNEDVSNWIEDPDRKWWFIELMHIMIKNHAKNVGLNLDTKTNRFYISTELGVDKVVKWKPGKRSATRNIVKFYKNESGEINFAAHRAVFFKFEMIGDEIFLLIDPQWTFTEDGYNPVRGKNMNILTNKWRTKEHNSSFLRDVLFWANFLTLDEKELKINEGPVLVSISLNPVEVSMNVGIKDDNISLDNILSEQKEDVIQPILSFERGQDDLLEEDDSADNSESTMEVENDE